MLCVCGGRNLFYSHVSRFLGPYLFTKDGALTTTRTDDDDVKEIFIYLFPFDFFSLSRFFFSVLKTVGLFGRRSCRLCRTLSFGECCCVVVVGAYLELRERGEISSGRPINNNKRHRHISLLREINPSGQPH